MTHKQWVAKLLGVKKVTQDDPIEKKRPALGNAHRKRKESNVVHHHHLHLTHVEVAHQFEVKNRKQSRNREADSRTLQTNRTMGDEGEKPMPMSRNEWNLQTQHALKITPQTTTQINMNAQNNNNDMFEQLKNLGYTANDILKGFSKGDKVM